MIIDSSFIAFVEVRHDLDFLSEVGGDEDRLKEKQSVGT
jgi:hypothetical protein